jgi:hypothetical protein
MLVLTTMSGKRFRLFMNVEGEWKRKQQEKVLGVDTTVIHEASFYGFTMHNDNNCNYSSW